MKLVLVYSVDMSPGIYLKKESVHSRPDNTLCFTCRAHPLGYTQLCGTCIYAQINTSMQNTGRGLFPLAHTTLTCSPGISSL